MKLKRFTYDTYELSDEEGFDPAAIHGFDPYILAELEFHQDDWPLVWKLLTRILKPDSIYQQSRHGMTTIQGWFREAELAQIVFSLTDAGYSFTYKIDGEETVEVSPEEED